MLNNNSKWAKSLTAVAVAGLLGACSRNGGEERTAAGTVDSAVVRTTSFTPAVGPGVQVTRTDWKSLTKALDYRIDPRELRAIPRRRR